MERVEIRLTRPWPADPRWVRRPYLFPAQEKWKNMSTTVVIGAQWGDEAKGKMVHVLGSQAEIVVRYSGGNNAGHTVVTGGQEYKFHLLPVGVLHPKTTSIIGSGMVVCPKELLKELQSTQEKCPSLGRLVISPAAHVVFPYHKLLDRLEEEARGENRIGTTERGIGPCYQDKIARIGIRMGELIQPELFASRLKTILPLKNKMLEMYGSEPLDFQTLLNEFQGYAAQLATYVSDTEPLVQEAVEQNKRVLFEGAQGSFLDIDSGTYPYVTSSHPTSAGACLGTGIGPKSIGQVLGVCKAYTTRVGAGPFPTELLDETGERIRQVGHEFGTTTGRPRRCGWMDLIQLRQSCRLNTITGLVVTRLDVLSGLKTIKASIGYDSPRGQVNSIPMNLYDFEKVSPIYRELPGWEEDLRAARKLSDLPENARRYLDSIEEFTKTPIAVVSIGPDHDETIVVNESLIW